MGGLSRRASPGTSIIRRPPVSPRGRLCFLALSSERSRREGVKPFSPGVVMEESLKEHIKHETYIFRENFLITTTPRSLISSISSLERLVGPWDKLLINQH